MASLEICECYVTIFACRLQKLLFWIFANLLILKYFRSKSSPRANPASVQTPVFRLKFDPGYNCIWSKATLLSLNSVKFPSAQLPGAGRRPEKAGAAISSRLQISGHRKSVELAGVGERTFPTFSSLSKDSALGLRSRGCEGLPAIC